jgi:hypothetical protein
MRPCAAHFITRVILRQRVSPFDSNSKYEEGFEKQTQVEQKTGIMAT